MDYSSARKNGLNRWRTSMERVKRARRDRDVETLIQLLHEPTGLLDEAGRELPDVRMSALRALGKLGDGRAVEPLAALLNDQRTQVAATSGTSLAGCASSGSRWRPSP